MKKYPNVLQHSEEDCGAACLATILQHYGRRSAISRIREAVGTGQMGTTMLGLKRGSEAFGFNARGAKASAAVLDNMKAAPLPAIIHWKGYHWVVLYGQQGKKYVLADPAVGIRYLSREELTEGWANGLILLLEPDPNRFFAQPDEKLSSFWRFFRPVWNYRGLLGEAFLINIILGLLSLTSPFLLQILTDDILVRGDTQLLGSVIIAIVVMELVSNSLRLVQSTLISHFAQRLELGLVLEFGRTILSLPMTYYESRRSGEIISRLRDIQEINSLVSQIVVGLPSQLFIAIISFGFMLFYSWKLTIASIIIAISMTLTTIIFLPALQQQTRKSLVLEAENQGVLVETFKGALTMKVTTAAPQFWDELQGRFGRLANVNFQTIQIVIINSTFSQLVSRIGGIVLLWLGSTLVIGKELSIGQLLAFNSMNGNFTGFILAVVGFVDKFTRAQTATQRLSEVVDSTPESEGDTRKPFIKIPGNAEIVCDDINFYHVGRADLLKNFSLTIPGGKVVALIGKSGCGKSTLAKIIAGLYPQRAQFGNIRIGDYNMNDISLDCRRQQIILVPQDAHFWSRSIIENFRLGYPGVTFEQIVRACKIAECDEFISKFPDKYQTVLGEFGANISGGQRQRLAIARAIVNDPPVLILDESTAGLDPVSEFQLLNQLINHRQGKTTLLISHRPRVIMRADWVVLIDEGKLKMEGTPDDLRSFPGEHLDFLTP